MFIVIILWFLIMIRCASTHPIPGCVGYTGGYGLHTYCVNVTTSDGRVVAPVACVTTEPGRKLKIEDATAITRGCHSITTLI